MDCPGADTVTGDRCGMLLVIPREQFEGMSVATVPAEVHAPLFHTYMNQQDPSWPKGGAGTGCVEFDLDGDEYVMHGWSAGRNEKET
jgi:hypothetical protein